jgi:hypothetical protein
MATTKATKPTAPKPTAIPLDHPVNSKITVTLTDLTPEVAEKWLSRNTLNRNVRQAKVREFAADMRNGKWHTDGDAIRFDWNGVMQNGQHRCLAVLESGVTIRVVVMKGLDPQARTVMDTGSKRSAADALKFAGFNYDTNMLAAVARIADARDSGYLKTALATHIPPLSHSDVIAWAELNPEVDHAIGLARRTSKSIGITPAVWAYCLYELEKIDGPAAVEFATSIADFRTGGKGDPRYSVIQVFRSAEAGRRRRPGVAEAIYVVFRAWNAWVTGKSLSQVIAGSPSTGGNDIPRPVTPTREVA